MRNFALTTCLTTIAAATMLQGAQARMASPENFPYWYLGLNTQLAYVSDADVGGDAGITDAQMDMGYGVGASIGYRPAGNGGLRGEVEYLYRDNNFDSFTVSGSGVTGTGDLISHNLMLNMFYDFDTGGRWMPYIGAGAGMSFADFKSTAVNTEDSGTNFAYQGMAGLVYRPQSLPDTEWGFGYRYFSTVDPDFTDASGNSIEYEYNSHNIELLSRFRF